MPPVPLPWTAVKKFSILDPEFIVSVNDCAMSAVWFVLIVMRLAIGNPEAINGVRSGPTDVPV